MHVYFKHNNNSSEYTHTWIIRIYNVGDMLILAMAPWLTIWKAAKRTGKVLSTNSCMCVCVLEYVCMYVCMYAILQDMSMHICTFLPFSAVASHTHIYIYIYIYIVAYAYLHPRTLSGITCYLILSYLILSYLILSYIISYYIILYHNILPYYHYYHIITEIPTIIDPSANINYPGATGSRIMGISVT